MSPLAPVAARCMALDNPRLPRIERSRAENSFCAIADGGPIGASTTASNGSGDPECRVERRVRRDWEPAA
jgi:hypothetical protein